MYAAKMQLKLMDESLEQFSGSLLLIKYAYLNETTFTPWVSSFCKNAIVGKFWKGIDPLFFCVITANFSQKSLL